MPYIEGNKIETWTGFMGHKGMLLTNVYYIVLRLLYHTTQDHLPKDTLLFWPRLFPISKKISYRLTNQPILWGCFAPLRVPLLK